jgi:hypothetical protein
MLDERSLRRDTFDASASVPCTLADGQVWNLPKPVYALAEGVSRFTTTWGREYERLSEALWVATEPAALVAAGAYLLRTAYDLPAGAEADLIPWRPDDPANAAMWKTIGGVFVGRFRKTMEQWARSLALIGGAKGPGPVFLEDARAAADMLVQMGRAVPAESWVEFPKGPYWPSEAES